MTTALHYNGLSVGQYFIGYLTLAMVKSIFMGTIISLGLFSSNLEFFTISKIFVLYILTSVALHAMSLFFTCFFKSPAVTYQIVCFIVFQSFLFYIGIESESVLFQLILSLSPKTPFIYGVGQLAFNMELMTNYDFSMSVAAIIFDILLYYLLFLFAHDARRSIGISFKNAAFRFFDFVTEKLRRRFVKRTPRTTPLLTHIGESDFPLQIPENICYESYKSRDMCRRRIQVRNLSKYSDGLIKRVVIDDVSLDIYEGQIFCVLGQKKAGKKMLMEMLIGSQFQSSGAVYYDGMELVSHYATNRQKFTVLPRSFTLFPYLTAYEHLEFFGKMREVPDYVTKRRANEILQSVGLGSCKDRYPSKLTQTQQRWLTLAMILVADPNIIYLQEPTRNMDSRTRAQFWNYLRELRNEGRSIVLFSLDLTEVERLADRIAVLVKGKLNCEGSVEYIREELGVGHILTIRQSICALSEEGGFEKRLSRILAVVSEQIPDAHQLQSISTQQIQFALPSTLKKHYAQAFTAIEQLGGLDISIDEVTLQDVLTSLGLRESVLDISDYKNQPYRDIEFENKAKQWMGNKPQYSFQLQFRAMAYRKFYQTFRNPGSMILVTIPIIIMFFKEFFRDEANMVIKLKLYIMVGFCLSGGAFIHFLVQERETKTSDALRVMGCRRLPFWLGTFFSDVIIASLVSAVIALVGYNFRIELFEERFDFFFCLCFTFYLNLITLAYFWNFGYDNAAVAQRAFGTTLLLIVFPFPFMIFKSSLPKLFPPIRFIRVVAYLVSPIQPFHDAMEELAWTQNIRSIHFSELLNLHHWYYPLFMLCTAIMYLLLTIYRSRRFDVPQSKERTKDDNKEPEDYVCREIDDLEDEYRRVMQNKDTDAIQSVKLTKIFKGDNFALKQLTFGVEPGEIMGLIGPIKAGKSTTLALLANLIQPTSGSIVYFGKEKDVVTDHSFIGYCPQNDPLWSNLTVDEHLKVFGMVRGLEGPLLTDMRDLLVDRLDLIAYRATRAESLTVSQKRKLSLAISLIGAPRIVLLDNTCAKLDIMDRKQVKTLLMDVARFWGSAVVVSMTNLNEAEGLSHRLGAMVNGQFAFVGSTNYLRKRFSNTYMFRLKSADQSETDLAVYMRKILPSAQESPSPNDAQDKCFIVKDVSFSFAAVYQKLSLLKHRGAIKSFSISSNSLEKAYINAANYQWMS